MGSGGEFLGGLIALVFIICFIAAGAMTIIYAILINLIYFVIGFVIAYIVWSYLKHNNNKLILILVVLGIIPCLFISKAINDGNFYSLDIVLLIIAYCIGLRIGYKKS